MTSCIFVADLYGRRKPDAAIFRAAAACLEVRASQVLFVGDKPREDIQGAHDVGMTTAWLRRGPRRQATRSRPCADVTINAVGDVIGMIGLATPYDQQPAHA